MGLEALGGALWSEGSKEQEEISEQGSGDIVLGDVPQDGLKVSEE